jgi:hypothetical protein
VFYQTNHLMSKLSFFDMYKTSYQPLLNVWLSLMLSFMLPFDLVHHLLLRIALVKCIVCTRFYDEPTFFNWQGLMLTANGFTTAVWSITMDEDGPSWNLLLDTSNMVLTSK